MIGLLMCLAIPISDPEKVKTHDFIDPEAGKAIPYGIYDLGRNRGWVSVGIDHDTAAFACTLRPVRVVVAPIRLTITSRLVSG